MRFVEQIEAMYAAGARVFVEAGPGRVLTPLVGEILGDRPHQSPSRATPRATPGSAASSWRWPSWRWRAPTWSPTSCSTTGLDRVDLTQLPLPAPGWTVDGHLVRTASGQVVPGSLQPADEFPGVVVDPAGPDPEREATVLEYLRSVREQVAAEREVMLRYLGAPDDAVAADRLAPAAATPAPPAAGDAAPPGERGAAAPEASSSPDPLQGDELLAVILQLVADRTGYPTDMLDPDLDLEADLSIDSIKRIEIIGELAERLGWDTAGDEGIDEAMVEDLAQLKSLREIVSWIDELDLGGDSETSDDERSGQPRRDELAEDPRAVDPHALDPHADDLHADDLPGPAAPNDLGAPPVTTRYVVSTVDLDPPDADRRHLEGTTVLITDDSRGVGRSVAAQLQALGASVSILAADHAPSDAERQVVGAADMLIWLRRAPPRRRRGSERLRRPLGLSLVAAGAPRRGHHPHRRHRRCRVVHRSGFRLGARSGPGRHGQVAEPRARRPHDPGPRPGSPSRRRCRGRVHRR